MFSVAIIGAGPAGCMSAFNIDKNIEVTLFDKNLPLKTLLPTGGGRCNFTHDIFDIKDLVKNYPRGEKFLYSVFSKFGVQNTLDFFESIGIKSYIQDNGRIFPVSNSASDVREKFLKQLNHCKLVHEEVTNIERLKQGFSIKTNKSKYFFNMVIISTGGKSNYNIIEKLGHTIIEPRPSLCGLKTKPYFTNLQGVSVRNCKITCNKKIYIGDILFTNDGITGPAVFEISSYMAREKFPYKITVDFINQETDWQYLFDKNPHKSLKNIVSEFLPKSITEELLKDVDLSIEGCKIKSEIKKNVIKILQNYQFEITGTRKHGETVTSGGVKLSEIDNKTMMSKLVEDLYFAGEVLDIDGLCGGFNLQNCWSTGYIAGQTINSKINLKK